MITADLTQIKRYESELKTFARKSYPFATKQTINRAAFEVRKKSQKSLQDDFTLRNSFTRQSIRVVQSRTLNVSQQEARVGSVAAYLETQEFGGTVKGDAGESKPIATSYSAGQGRGVRPRTRLPRKPNRLQSISLRKRSTAAARKQRNRIAVQEAAAGGSKYVYLNLGRRKGLFKVTGGVRRPKVNMVWDLSRRAVQVRSKPWLKPSTDKIKRQMPRYYAEALRYQLQRQGLG